MKPNTINAFHSRGQSLALLLMISVVPRILGAFLLPNAFGDAYVYIQEIGTLSTKISNGTFRLTDLFGFWLPLYQFISAIVNVFVRNGFYSGKIIAALFGAGTCVLVYLVTNQLTKNQKAAFWMFLLIAFNPLHIFYSASAMTDVPHSFFVLAALYFVLTGNWIVAAIFGALAGFTRVESWMLIALIPFLQFIRGQRLSIAAIVILIIPPLLWFYISWKATGNWLACFVQRQEYHDWLLRTNPSIAHFSVINSLKDAATLLVSSDVAVLIASLVAGWFVLKRGPELLKFRTSLDNATGILTPVLFFFAILALLIAAYLTHQQPIIFPRYGLILFTLGLPILAWTFLRIRKLSPQFARKVLIAIVAVCTVDATIQFAGAVGTINQYRTQRAVADYLRTHFDPNSGARIFCDEGTVRVLSGIPEDRFITSSGAASEVSTASDSDRVGRAQDIRSDDAALIKFLKTTRVEYFVVANVQGSIAASKMRGDLPPDFDGFETIFHKRTAFLPTDIWLLKTATPRK